MPTFAAAYGNRVGLPQTVNQHAMNQPKQHFRQPLTERQYLVPFVLVTLLFFLWGFARAVLDLLNKHFQNEIGISITQSALIQVTTYVGYFLMALPSGMFINRFGYRKGVVLGLILFAVGAFLFVPGTFWGGFEAFLFALFVIGCGLTFLETAANPYVTQLGPAATSTSRLNLSQSFNGLGGIFATAVVGQFLFRNEGAAGVADDASSGNVAVPYAVLGILVLVIAWVFSRVNLPEISHAASSEADKPTAPLRRLLHHRMFLFGLGALLAYEVAEISINSYFINFVTGMQWMSDRTASVVLTLALGCFMAGRLLGSYIMKCVRATLVLAVCAVGTVVCCALVLANFGTVSLVSLLGIYLFEAVMFPTIFSLALKGLGNLTKSAASMLMMTPIGGCGFLAMGYLADTTDLVFPFVVPLAGFCIVAAYALRTLVLYRNE